MVIRTVRGVKAVEIKNKDTTPSKLKKEIGGYLIEIVIYKSRATVKRITKNI